MPRWRRRSIFPLFLLIILIIYLGIPGDLGRFARKGGETGQVRLAVAVKTGQNVARERVTGQLDSFLKGFSSWILVAERDSVVAGAKVHGVLASNSTGPEEEPFSAEVRINSTSLPGLNSSALANTTWTPGWTSDAHKNLPAFKLLYQSFQSADWYLLIDDDTYLFYSNLIEVLKTWNASEEVYLGNPTQFTGCDRVNKYGKGPWFAHGGSGILLSRAALLKLIAGLDRCVEKYEKCWAGDIRVALCLRDVGILLHHQSNGQRGTRINFHGRDPARARWGEPCSLPATYHRIAPPLMREIWEIERNLTSLNLRTTYADVFHGLFTGLQKSEIMSPFDRNLARPGSDLPYPPPDLEYTRPKACQVACELDPKCVAWSWTVNEQKCALKKGVPSKLPKRGAVSGAIVERYLCGKDKDAG